MAEKLQVVTIDFKRDVIVYAAVEKFHPVKGVFGCNDELVIST